MTGLILEGGAFRGLYTDGVLDALLRENIQFDYIIGVSAGISNGYSYASGQTGRNMEIIRRYIQDPRYFGLSNLAKCRSIFGLDFVFGEIPHTHVPFDYDALHRFPGKVLAGVTNADTGEIEYFDRDPEDPDLMLLRASCAIPLFFPVIPYKGKRYFDGGLAEPIPIKKALADGCAKNLVVLTQPEGYVKKPSKLTPRLVKLRYKNLGNVVKNRHIHYNESVKFCEKLEREKKAVLLRPQPGVNVGRFERDLTKLQALYDAGFEDTIKDIQRIRSLFTD